MDVAPRIPWLRCDGGALQCSPAAFKLATELQDLVLVTRGQFDPGSNSLDAATQNVCYLQGVIQRNGAAHPKAGGSVRAMLGPCRRLRSSCAKAVFVPLASCHVVASTRMSRSVPSRCTQMCSLGKRRILGNVGPTGTECMLPCSDFHNF